MLRCGEEDLARRLCGALDFAEHVIQRLASSGFVDEENPAQSVRAEKVISETGVFLLAASALSHIADVAARVQHLATLLVPHARSERIRIGICRQPSLALDYAQAHACLRRMGHPDAEFDGLLRAAAASQCYGARERPPHRVLEQRWIAAMCGFSGSRALAARPARASAVGRPLDVLFGSREEGYAFTHAVMYLADECMGGGVRLPRTRAELFADADALLVGCLDDQDYDLAGEALLTWPLLRGRWSATAAFAFHTLAAVEEEASFLPSAGTRLDRLGALEGSRRTDYFLATSYHTIYVMGWLCAASLKNRRCPPPSLGVFRSPSSNYEVFEAITADLNRPPPHWQHVAMQLTDSERGALLGFFLSILLRRAARAGELSRVRELLEKAVSAGVANGPLWSQAAELVLRGNLLITGGPSPDGASSQPRRESPSLPPSQRRLSQPELG